MTAPADPFVLGERVISQFGRRGFVQRLSPGRVHIQWDSDDEHTYAYPITTTAVRPMHQRTEPSHAR